MSGIDDRVVQMKFDNAAFGSAVNATIAQLANLKKSLDFSNSTKGMQDLQGAANNFKLGNVGASIDGASAKFLALATIGITALTRITDRAISTGIALAKSLTVSPIVDGLHEYETNLNAIQTILSNTQSAGTTLDDVNRALDDLNHYSDQTIYNFAEMAKNIGTFTAAGVDLKTSTESIKGIANLAALSGSNAQQASTAMYQLSQAIAAGQVHMQDWNSVVNAGMGGTVFQRALANTGVAMGTIDKNAVKLTGSMKNVSIHGESFRNSLTPKKGEKSWLSSEVLTNTLKQFTGDLSDAQLAAQGFSAAEIKSIQETAKTAFHAATEVKTLHQVFDVAKESMGSGWAETFKLIFGNFTEAKGTFTGLSNVINGVINKWSDARNQLIGDWKSLGGRTVAIDAIKSAFAALMSVLKPIHDAFREIFPPKTAHDLFDLTLKIRAFFDSLKLGTDAGNNLRRTFAGIFAIFDIGKQIVAGLFHVIGDLFGALSSGGKGGGWLSFTGGLGDFLVKVDEAIKKGGILTAFFSGLGKVLALPIKLIGVIAGAIGRIFDGSSIKRIGQGSDALGKVNDRLSPFKKLLDTLGKAWGVFLNGLNAASNGLGTIVGKIAEGFGKLPAAIAKAIGNGDYSAALSTINTGLFAAIVLMLKRFTTGSLFKIGGQNGFFKNLSQGFQALTGSLKSMQHQIQAKTLLILAGAIALLAASVAVLSLIDPKRLASSLGAMTAAFAQLLIGMAILIKISGPTSFFKIQGVASALILMATAILILSAAVTVMSKLSPGELVKGLAGVAVLLAIVSAAVIPLSAASGPMLRAGASLILLATALNILAGALKIMATMSWSEMAKGLAGVAASLLILAGAMQIMPKGMILQAAALVAVGVALNLIAGALKIMATMSWNELAKGLVGLGGALLVLAVGLDAMSGSIPGAIGLGIAAAGIMLLVPALILLGKMSWGEIGRGLVALGGALLVLAVGLTAMIVSLPGAAALLVASAALAILAPVLLALGLMSWESIAKGLATLAGVFIILGLAGLALTPVIPTLLGLGAAIALIGVGVALAGAGVAALAAGITALVAVGTAGITILTTLLTAIIGLIPALAISLAQGIVAMAVEIGNGAPKIVDAFVKILVSLLDAVVKLSPRIAAAVGVLIVNILKIIVDNVPKIADAGLKLLIGLLEAIRNNIGKVITVAVDVIVAFLHGLGSQLPRIVDAAFKMIIDFVNGISDAIDAHSAELGQAAGRLAVSIIEGLVKGLAAGVGQIGDAAANLGKAALSGIGHHLGIGSPSKEFEKIGIYVNQGFAKGLLGGLDATKAALDKMKATIQTAIDSSTAMIATQKSKLEELNSRKRTKANSAGIDLQIKKANAALKEAEALHKREIDAQDVLTKGMKKQQKQLVSLSKQYDDVTEKLKLAQTTLDDAIKQRDDFSASVTQEFSVLPSIDADTTLDSYFDAIRNATTANQKFKTTLDDLRAIGLDDPTYKKFLNEGVSAQPFLDALLASGKSGVDEIDKITGQLNTSATSLGLDAAAQLYQAGVNAAQGLVDGLTAKQAVIEDKMTDIAKALVKAIKKELGIKSPSTVFEEIGKFSNQGLADGLNKYSIVAETAALGVGETALNAVKNTMSRISDAISGDLDMNPVIAPVLDLDAFRKNAAGINDILAPRAITPTVSTDKASTLASDAQAAQQQAQDNADLALVAGDTFAFTQYNNSPKALSTAEIYRQTRNQLSIAKGALPK